MSAPENSEALHLAILKGAIESANEAFVTIDQDHRIVFFNNTAEAMLGYKADEVTGRDLQEILGPTCPAAHRQSVEHYVATREPRYIGHATELFPTRKNGQSFPAMISFSVAEVQGRLYFTAIIRDLTEKKIIEAQVRRAEQLAGLGQLVAEVTHEIKNPLMMIGGFAKQLLDNPDQEKKAEKLKIIVDEVKRLEGLLRELNDFYMPRELNLDEFDVNELLRETCALSKSFREKRNIDLSLDLTETPIRISGDRGKLKQVLLNLIKNGLEAMESQGTLRVRTLKNGDQAEIQVEDTGSGMSPEVLDKIFDPFFTTKSGGTGLGLPVSKKIIENHEGARFEISSREGQGTTVTLTLPLLDTINPEQA